MYLLKERKNEKKKKELRYFGTLDLLIRRAYNYVLPKILVGCTCYGALGFFTYVSFSSFAWLLFQAETSVLNLPVEKMDYFVPG